MHQKSNHMDHGGHYCKWRELIIICITLNKKLAILIIFNNILCLYIFSLYCTFMIFAAMNTMKRLAEKSANIFKFHVMEPDEVQITKVPI